MIKKLLHTRYRVTDLERTVAFYRDVLGLEETRRHTSGRGSQLVFFKAPESEEEIEICKYDKSGPVVVGPDLTHLAFEVDDLEKFAKQAAAKGYPLSDGPHPNGNNFLIITKLIAATSPRIQIRECSASVSTVGQLPARVWSSRLIPEKFSLRPVRRTRLSRDCRGVMSSRIRKPGVMRPSASSRAVWKKPASAATKSWPLV